MLHKSEIPTCMMKDIELLEKTKKFVLRVCYKDWATSYCDLLNSCQVSFLSNWQKVAKLC